MSEAYNEADVIRIEDPGTTRDTTGDTFPFMLGDHPTVYVATRPKMAVLLRLASVMTDGTDEQAQVSALPQMINRVMDKPSADALWERLLDDDDDLDLDSPLFIGMFKTMVGRWFGARPTGRQAASRRSASRTGKRSTARSRSAG